MKINFNLNFHTKLGEKIQMLVYEGGQERIYFLSYTDNGNWTLNLDYFSKEIVYRYQLVDEGGNVLDEELAKHGLQFNHTFDEYRVFDVWNLKNFPENYLINKVLHNVLRGFKPEKNIVLKRHTHLFRIEAPLYNADWRIVLIGNSKALGQWDYENAIPMHQVDYGVWEVALEIGDATFLQYKYGLQSKSSGEVLNLEYGQNRWSLPNKSTNQLQIQADHYFRFKSAELYHAAGVAVPVFSLRSAQGCGVGEFCDLKQLGDWAKKANLSVIQTLPINDTTANWTWTDSYPYAPISLYALHPLYLRLDEMTVSLNEHQLNTYHIAREDLNNLELIDYEKVMRTKKGFLEEVFSIHYEELTKDRKFRKFQKQNESWLFPYAAFCTLRDKYGTPDFNQWKTHKKYVKGKVRVMNSAKHKDYPQILFHSWLQYELHLQLSSAIEYLHDLGISVKGDLPIGIYRYSVEAWTEPELYGMEFQAGAPPDQFTDLGQNWGFPTYNWEVMKQTDYKWWKSRFAALEQYFDAMRIDHILGFFRIWRMPISAVQGILGYFYPAIPITLSELHSRHIAFNYERFCRPFITDQILSDYFGFDRERVQLHFLNNHFNGTYSFKEEFDSQRKLFDYFQQNPQIWPEEQLLGLMANVLFIAEEIGEQTVFHPRFNLEKTDSFKFLTHWEQEVLKDLYVDYFFRRQDALWYKSAMEKLPAILNSTNMLICGEDLGLVPTSVPVVMDKLGLTALKVQRMPGDQSPWYNPKEASYLNVVTASSHDSSTLRQWWNEDRDLTQRYFNEQLGQWGSAPVELVPELAEIIMLQHLYNDAMLAIFPLQEFLATDETLRHPNPDMERINEPAVFPHYWRYRMHLNVESLSKHTDFTAKIAGWVQDSGRKV